jgi:choline dehydrogenase-like flavoprotein
MPFIDLNQQDTIEQLTGCDVVIIGAGAAGILCAVELTEKGHKVGLVESGNFHISEERQSLNKVSNTAKELTTALNGRYRAIGGTTLAWGGQSLPFSRLDFAKRDWVPLSGWPIPYSEVGIHYNKANRFMGVDELDYGTEILDRLQLKDPGFDNRFFYYHVSKWAPQPNFQTLYKDYLDKHVLVIYNAALKKMRGNATDITEILLINFRKRVFSVKIRQLILAAGGIETVRILLDNQQSEGGPLQDRSGLLGKMFMEHPCICIGTIRTAKNKDLQRKFNTHIYNRRKYSFRISLTEQFQQESQLLNCSASIMFGAADDDAADPYQEIRKIRHDLSVKGLFRIARSTPRLIRTALALVLHKFIYKPGAAIKLILMTEQEPRPDSFISLDGEKDELGMPRARINWLISPLTWTTTVTTAEKLKTEIERLQLGNVELEPWVRPETPDWQERLSDVNHHMGGARMSATPETGIVDTDGKVWETGNLFVCSTAVFPTGSHSNPTLTLLALGIRLSATVSNKIKNKSPLVG